MIKRFLRFNTYSGTLFIIVILVIFMRLYGTTLTVTESNWLGMHTQWATILLNLHSFYFKFIEPFFVIVLVRALQIYLEDKKIAR
ncbi:hypothetical protein [Fusibacter ferrireducens]|uniref:Uncharacterized protein n=1 Tax=Fusibacter ferrireducens TaxID=2785058 RepID=A0ABR9ZR51_9FIRM|nr:hypothetical protein [Fusibacter ferrireducens]MBF4692933.1 hypothetical protein [Fusibacter ferrireducens]